MKALHKKMIWFTLIALTGVVLLGAEFVTKTQDSWITGFASGLIAVSLLKIVQFMRIKHNPELLRKFEISQNEERFIMIAHLSSHYTLMLTIFVQLIAAVIFIFLQNRSYVQFFACSAALESFAYCLFYVFLSKKY